MMTIRKAISAVALTGLLVVAGFLLSLQGILGARAQNALCSRSPGGAEILAISGCTINVTTGTLTIATGATWNLDGTAVTASGAELNTVDITTAGTAEASKALTLDSNKDFTGVRNGTLTGTVSAEQLTSTDDITATDNFSGASYINTDNVGTVGTGVTAAEYGNGFEHVTVLTLTSVAYTIGDNAALADGALIYTFPAGEVVVEACMTSVSLTLTTGTPTTDTPEICLGTVIGTGAVATCGTTATFEDILGPDVAADMAGTVNTLTQIGPTADNAGFVIADGDAHTLHLNIADTWADVDNTAATSSGTVVCKWTWLHNPA